MDNAEPSHTRSYSGMATWLLLALLAAACALCIRIALRDQATGQTTAASVGVFDARLQSLENTAAAQEKRIKDLEDETQKLEHATPQTAATPALVAGPAAGEDRIAALEKEITALKAASPMQDEGRIVKSIRLLSALHRLSDRIIGGKPFTNELTAFEETASPDESPGSPFATLAPYADSGIPTFATLLASFDQAVEGLNAAEAVAPVNATPWERFKYNLMHLVTVRRISENQNGKAVDDIVGRAQAHLERQEVEAAVTEIKSLPDNARSNFSGWLDDAQMVTEAPSLVGQIEEQVMQKAFAPPTAPSAPAAAQAVLPAVATPAPAQDDAAPSAPKDSKTD